jgi:HD-like signal output (HDOD) protein
VAARCDSEAANVLGLNMVHELVTGKRTVQEARHTSEQSTVAYNAGREAPYAERLLFAVPQGGTEDPDESHLSGSLLQQAVGKLKDALTPGGGEEASDRRTPS